jgi:tetratricopeptide (TPR) repeat protein
MSAGAAEALRPAPPERHGFCAPPQLAEMIRDLYLEERTGILSIVRSGAEKRLYLDRGMILVATSSLEDERLPAFLAARGMLRPEEAEALRGLDDLQASLAVQKRGQATDDQLLRAFRELAQQVMMTVFRWEELEYRFVEQGIPAWPARTDVMVSFELIIRSLRSMAGFEPLRQSVARQERAVRLSEHLYLPFEQLSLSPIEGYLVSRIDGRTRPRDILAQMPPADEENASRFLFGLLILGLAEFSPPLGPGMLTCDRLLRGDEEKRRREENELQEVRAFYRLACAGDPIALLGLTPAAPQEDVRAAYNAKKERYDPGRFMRRVQAVAKEEFQIIEARLLEAFLDLRARPLTGGQKPEPTGEQKAAVDAMTMGKRKEMSKTELQSEADEKLRLAEQYLNRARDYWKMGDIYNCIRYCEFAQNQNDADANVQSLLGQALSRNPDHRWQRRAETALLRAAELEPFNPHHCMMLGDFYKGHRLAAKARRQYEKALEILPAHAGARQALKELGSGSKGRP